MIKSALLIAAVSFSQAAPAAPPENFYALEARSNEAKPAPLSAYRDKVSLAVNTASKCGLTPQYKALQALHEKFGPKGFTVLAFPRNDFLGQEPGADPEIKKFCEVNYGVTFPLFAKNPVKGKKTQPIFKFLKDSPVGSKDGEIGWNFTKFLIARDGTVAARFGPRTKPDAPEVLAKIEDLLSK